jgi:hypothetical protein
MTVLERAGRCSTRGTRAAALHRQALAVLTSVRWRALVAPAPPPRRACTGLLWRCTGAASEEHGAHAAPGLGRLADTAAAAMTSLLARVLRRPRGPAPVAAPDASSHTRAALEPGAARRLRALERGLRERTALRVHAGAGVAPLPLRSSRFTATSWAALRCRVCCARRPQATFASAGLHACARPDMGRRPRQRWCGGCSCRACCQCKPARPWPLPAMSAVYQAAPPFPQPT